MRSVTVGKSLRVVSHIVLLAMAGAIVYAAWITLKYWSGISV